MTRAVVRMVVLAVVLVGVNVRPADASLGAFWDYLEHLSGPGPFNGIGLDAPLICDDRGVSLRCLVPPALNTVRRVEIAPSFSWMGGKDGGEDLVYDGPAPDIGAITFGGTFTGWLTNRFGATVRLASIHFTGSGVSASDTFARVGPIVGFRLNGPLSGWRITVSPQVQFGLGPFDSEEFGARPGRRLTEPVRLHIQIAVEPRW